MREKGHNVAIHLFKACIRRAHYVQALDPGPDKTVVNEAKKHPQGLHSGGIDRQFPIVVNDMKRIKPSHRLEHNRRQDWLHLGEYGQGGPL